MKKSGKQVAAALWILALLSPTSVLPQDNPEQAALDTIPVASAQDRPKPLLEITVTGGRVASQTVEDATASPLQGVPETQALSRVVRTREDLQQRGAVTMSQALETVSSAQAPATYQLQAQGAFALRGFDLTILQDGFQNLGLAGDRDSLVGVERLDVLKGPGASMNSGALGLAPGGVADLQSRWPGQALRFRAEASGSRYDQREQTVEVDTGRLLPFVSAGYAGAQSEGRGFFDFSTFELERRRPSASLRALGGRVSVFRDESLRTLRDHPGLPTTGTLDPSRFRIPDERSVMDPDVPLSFTRLEASGLDAEIPLGFGLTLSGATRKAHSALVQRAQYVTSNSPDLEPTTMPTTWNRLAGTYDQYTEQRQSRLRLQAQADAGAWGRFNLWGGISREDAPDFVDLRIGLATPIDLVNPRYGNWMGAPIPFGIANSEFNVRNRMGGLQWRVGDWFNGFAAITHTQAEVRNRQESPVDILVREQLGSGVAAVVLPVVNAILGSGVLPDLGLSVDRVDTYKLRARQVGAAVRLADFDEGLEEDGLWLFGGQGNGHRFQAYFVSGDSPKPELSRQREFGLRLVGSDTAKIALSRFRIERRNVPTLDPASPTGFRQITTGLQSVEGTDAEFTLRPPWAGWDRLTLTGGAARLDSRLEEDQTFAVGNELQDVPRRSSQVQLSVELLRGALPVQALLGRRCQSAVQGDLANSFTVPGRCLNDAGVSAAWRGLELRLQIFNLDDTRYYEPYTYLFNGVIPGDRRNARVLIGYTFQS